MQRVAERAREVTSQARGHLFRAGRAIDQSFYALSGALVGLLRTPAAVVLPGVGMVSGRSLNIMLDDGGEGGGPARRAYLDKLREEGQMSDEQHRRLTAGGEPRPADPPPEPKPASQD
jgi:hypothetical protein